MDVQEIDQLSFLDPLVTEAKKQRMEEVLDQRTDYIRVVLEDVYQSHNASAVMRSCECFGIQSLHAIENQNRYQLNPDVARGASNWMTLVRHRATELGGSATNSCLTALRQAGYKIAVASPGAESYPIAALPLDHKIAVCFGTEWKGVSPVLAGQADYHVHIPMFGFTQSFNVSVSVALCLYELTNRLRSECIDWHLDEPTRQQLRLEWRKRTVRFADRILKAAEHRGINSP